MSLLLATSIIANAGTVAITTAAILGAVKLGDRLWGRRQNGNSLPNRVTRLETEVKITNVKIDGISKQLSTTNEHLFLLLKDKR